MAFFYSLLGAIAIVTFAFAALGIKIIVRRNGQFKRPCSSTDPYTGQRHGCLCHNNVPSCKKNSSYQPLDINSEFCKECNL